MKQKELELENEIGSETELEYFFKGKKLRRVFELAFLLALGAMIWLVGQQSNQLKTILSAQQRGFVIIAYSGNDLIF